jgi:hypothetical protein
MIVVPKEVLRREKDRPPHGPSFGIIMHGENDMGTQEEGSS